MKAAERFLALAPRERLLIGVAAGLAVIAVVVLGIINPLMNSRRALETELAEKQAALGDIERVAARFGKAGGAAAAAARSSSESLVVVMDRTARTRGLSTYLRRNEPDGPNGIRLHLENIPFDDLIGWLGELQGMHGISVSSASVDPAQDPGRVSVNLQLSRAAAH